MNRSFTRWGIALAIFAGILTEAESASTSKKTTSTPSKTQVKSAPKPAVKQVAAVAAGKVSDTLLQKTRKEFQQLGLEMVGMAKVMGESAVYLKYKGMRDPMICSEGQVLGGFKIVSIQEDYTVFEGNSIRLWLKRGEETPVEHEPVSEEELAEEVEETDGGDAEVKPADGLKTKTKAYGRSLVDTAGSAIRSITSLGEKSAPKVNIRAKERIVYNGKVIEIADADTEDADSLMKDSGNIKWGDTKTSGKEVRFIMPIKGTLSSGFGYRKQPTGGARKYHMGVDIQAPNKSPIVAAASGVVEEVSRSWAKGLNILIRHDGGYHTAYFHLSKAVVKEGQKVTQGQLIGNEGMTGVTTGPHLHFEIHKNGQPVDPARYLPQLSR